MPPPRPSLPSLSPVSSLLLELTDVAPVLPSASPMASRVGRRRRSARVACVGDGVHGEGHLMCYAAAPRRKAVEAVARDLRKLWAMGLVAGDVAKEKVLSEATDLLQELSQMFYKPELGKR